MSFGRQGGRLSPAGVATVVGALPLLAVILAASGWKIPVADMTRDVAAIARIHPLSGFLSSLGILLWWTGASVCLFGALSLHRQAHRGGAATDGAPLLFTGLLSGYFALDDLFQFHEALAPDYLGLPERAVYVVMALAVLAYLARCRSLLRGPRRRWLMLALCLMAASTLVDVVGDRWLWRISQAGEMLLEDGLKWVGIVAWTGHAVLCTLDAVARPRGAAGVG